MIEILERLWHIIIMDFVVKLLKSKDLVTGIEYDII